MSDRVSDETELIQTYLAPLAAGMPGALGLSDDAAVIATEPGVDVVVSTDPVIAGVHFFADDAPEDIAWKALAVNVSDLAAKGATPFAYTMALAFPEAPRRDWMAQFCSGLREAQAAFGCKLIGGDTDRTPGPLSIGVTAFGKVAHGRLVERRTANVGDHVFVTGTIGDAALGLLARRDRRAFDGMLDAGQQQFLLERYLRPQPRLSLGPVLRNFASAALDISDGLLKDAARLAAGARGHLAVRVCDLPLSDAARAVIAADRDKFKVIVAGGDDYEILFAVAPACLAEFEDAVGSVPVTKIGVLTQGTGVTLISESGAAVDIVSKGYDHLQPL